MKPNTTAPKVTRPRYVWVTYARQHVNAQLGVMENVSGVFSNVSKAQADADVVLRSICARAGITGHLMVGAYHVDWYDEDGREYAGPGSVRGHLTMGVWRIRHTHEEVVVRREQVQ